MKILGPISGLAVPLDATNIDTDQLVPSRFLMKPRDYDYGSLLFCDLRLGPRRDPAFPLNAPRYAKPVVILANANFGCGSAREQAVYALQQYGIRAIVGTSFGDIFRRNCIQNGLVVGVISENDRAALSASIHTCPGAVLTVDLRQQVVVGPGGRRDPFGIGQTEKAQLLSGLGDVDRTGMYGEAIAAFERTLPAAVPWLDLDMAKSAAARVGAR